MIKDSKSVRTKAIIVDIDGTLSNDSWRRASVNEAIASPNPDWDHINKMSMYDMPNQWCLAIIDAMRDKGYKVLFVTARNEKYRQITLQWLNANVVGEFELFMRPTNDLHPDFVMKRSLYYNNIDAIYDVEFCLEDRDAVSSMWREIGLVCLQCARENN